VACSQGLLVSSLNVLGFDSDLRHRTDIDNDAHIAPWGALRQSARLETHALERAEHSVRPRWDVAASKDLIPRPDILL
jgi:hypothetical protein